MSRKENGKTRRFMKLQECGMSPCFGVSLLQGDWEARAILGKDSATNRFINQDHERVISLASALSRKLVN